MSRPLFTPEELAELARIDAELESAPVTADELAESRRRDRAAQPAAMDKRARRMAEQQRQYYAAHREEIAEQKRQYYAAHREEIAERMRQYREAHREEIAERMAGYYPAYYYADRPTQDGIRARRKALRMSQAELGRQVGVSPSLICMVEKGRCTAAPQTMRRIEEALEEMEGGRH